MSLSLWATAAGAWPRQCGSGVISKAVAPVIFFGCEKDELLFGIVLHLRTY